MERQIDTLVICIDVSPDKYLMKYVETITQTPCTFYDDLDYALPFDRMKEMLGGMENYTRVALLVWAEGHHNAMFLMNVTALVTHLRGGKIPWMLVAHVDWNEEDRSFGPDRSWPGPSIEMVQGQI